MASSLSQADVMRLLAEPSPLVRAEVAAKVAEEIDNPQMTEAELALVQDIIRLMAKDVEKTVRKALAQNLRSATRLPHDVALRLASDVEEIALPILAYSPVLTDYDLIAIVRSGSSAKQEAVAERPNVTEMVSDVLIETADETAVATLMNNKTAHISDAGFTKAVDRFQSSEIVKENMVRRSRLPIAVTEWLVNLVSENLKDYLVSHHELPAALASDLVMHSRERSIINLNSNSSEQDVENLVDQMHAHGRLTSSLIMRALCVGDLVFFEAALARLANVPLANARALIRDPGRLGLKSLYAKTGLPNRFLPVMKIAIDVVHETPLDGGRYDLERYRARVIERILTQYEDLSTDDVDYLLEKLDGVSSLVS